MPQFHYPLKPGNNKYTKVFGAIDVNERDQSNSECVCGELLGDGIGPKVSL